MQVIQNQAMRLIVGVPKSTSAASTGRELDILPIECRANIRRARFMLKVKSQAHHPLHDAVCTPPRRRHVTDWIQEMHQCYADLMENDVNVDPGLYHLGKISPTHAEPLEPERCPLTP